MKIPRIFIPVFAYVGIQVAVQGQMENLTTTMVSLHYPMTHDTRIDFANSWIKPLDKTLNSEYPDYTPMLTANGNTIYFTSRRPGNTGNRKTIDKTYKAEDIYFSTLNAEGNWKPATKVKGKLNSFKNEAITWISEEGDKMILCQNEDLFESKLVNGVWTKPEPIEIINTDFRETHASYSPDLNTLFFTTDDPELATVGGLDICMVKRTESGIWGTPTIVKNINSVLNEENPILMDDNRTLWFSSQGFSGFGGYDVFASTLNELGEFSAPVNPGRPINTDANEPFISFSKDGKKAFLSSDRGAKHEQNMYEVTFPEFIQVPLIVEVYDADTKELITSTITVVEKTRMDELEMDHVTKGIFATDQVRLGTSYTIATVAPGYVGEELVLSTSGLQDINLKEFELHQKVFLKKDKKKEIVLNRIVFFDFDERDMTSASIHVVEKIREFLVENPSTFIVINGHTDSKGSNRYNDKLADKRSVSVANWFVQNGIDMSRIQVKGFGEINPTVDNLTDSNRALNRRAEIEIFFAK